MAIASGEAFSALAFLIAVRSVERWARLRTCAARDFRIFFFADAIFGMTGLVNSMKRKRFRFVASLVN